MLPARLGHRRCALGGVDFPLLSARARIRNRNVAVHATRRNRWDDRPITESISCPLATAALPERVVPSAATIQSPGASLCVIGNPLLASSCGDRDPVRSTRKWRKPPAATMDVRVVKPGHPQMSAQGSNDCVGLCPSLADLTFIRMARCGHPRTDHRLSARVRPACKISWR